MRIGKQTTMLVHYKFSTIRMREREREREPNKEWAQKLVLRNKKVIQNVIKVQYYAVLWYLIGTQQYQN